MKFRKVRNKEIWISEDGKWQIEHSITPARYSTTGKEMDRGYGIWHRCNSFEGINLWNQRDFNGEYWFKTKDHAEVRANILIRKETK